MAKRVAFTDQTKAELRAIPQHVAIQILRTLARFLPPKKAMSSASKVSSRPYTDSEPRITA